MPLIDFITTFNNTNNKNVYRIDPLNTFSMNFRFEPGNSKIIQRITDCKFSSLDEFNKNMDKFVQRIQLPNFTVTNDANADTIAHLAIMHKMLLNPEQQTFTMDVINTKVPILEEVFYPWMREIQYPSWQYSDQPFTTADLEINLTSHSDISYHLLKCRPTSIDTYNPSQELTAVTRSIIFTFDLIYVKYAGNYSQNTLMNLASKLINKGLKTIGL